MPWELKPLDVSARRSRRRPLVISQSAISSASSTACLMDSTVASMSTTTPLRRPARRMGADAHHVDRRSSVLRSATTAQILVVPMSSPTISSSLRAMLLPPLRDLGSRGVHSRVAIAFAGRALFAPLDAAPTSQSRFRSQRPPLLGLANRRPGRTIVLGSTPLSATSLRIDRAAAVTLSCTAWLRARIEHRLILEARSMRSAAPRSSSRGAPARPAGPPRRGAPAQPDLRGPSDDLS